MDNKNRRKLLEFIIKYAKHHGFGPKVEEMREAMGFTSNSSVVFHVRVLAEEGLVEFSPRKHRGVLPSLKGKRRLNLKK